ncbi:MAG: phosphatidylglycerol lysyltransferase domain-containing protein [Thermodesulfobacteriota bacterium]
MPQKSSDLSFVNLWGWAEAYGLQWAWDETLVWILQTRPESRFWAPAGAWDRVEWKSLFHEFRKEAIPWTRIPEKLVESWKNQKIEGIHLEEERGNWDYLYSFSELASLKGNRFHKKKNLLNQFLKKYSFTYIPLDSVSVHRALGMQETWCIWRDCESSDILTQENKVIEKVLLSWENFAGILGGALLIDDRMAAYTVGERLDDTMLLIHFEKGDPEYQGIYQAINQLFLSHQDQVYETVNREQDLDDPGLRKAKLSYNPVDYVRKYKATFIR